MPTIEVKTEKLGDFSVKARAINSSIGNIEACFSSLVSSLDWDIQSSAGIKSISTQISTNLKSEASSVNKLAAFLSVAQGEYEKLDNIETPSVLEEESTISSVDISSFLLKLLDKVGPMGKITSGSIGFIQDLLDCDSDVFSVLEFLGTIGSGSIKAIDVLLGESAVSSGGFITSSGWAELFGFNFKDTGFSNYITDEMDNLTGAKGTLSSVAKWGGYVISGIKNTSDNWSEYTQEGSDMSVGAFIGESVLETGYDIGLGILGTAAASAAIAAVGFASAPAVVIGAAGVGVVIGANAAANWIYQSVTGSEDTFKEAASTFIVDTVESGVNKAKEIATNIGNSIGSAISSWNPIAKWSFA